MTISTELIPKKKKIPTINICIILFIIVFFLSYGYHFFQSIKCGDNMMILRIAIEIYAQDNKGKYPQNLNKLDEGKYFQEGFFTKRTTCTIGKCKYKYISKIIKNGDKEINYYILRCPKHEFIFDSSGLCSNEKKDSIKNGKIDTNITLTDEELKQLGFK